MFMYLSPNVDGEFTTISTLCTDKTETSKKKKSTEISRSIRQNTEELQICEIFRSVGMK